MEAMLAFSTASLATLAAVVSVETVEAAEAAETAADAAEGGGVNIDVPQELVMYLNQHQKLKKNLFYPMFPVKGVL